ncbi:hypothetical protein SBRY_70167 [Actinacidiphila bryophytorum]|uniref:Uncharacterized protein n=1 Tax=Actinacidiphila bryophytorum TaxID=1436133 RepID=A0A9W4H771_9ACTN|nr:hypothetical protein SBRY_70167 [Actinacidiphila bryophytorum]
MPRPPGRVPPSRAPPRVRPCPPWSWSGPGSRRACRAVRSSPSLQRSRPPVIPTRLRSPACTVRRTGGVTARVRPCGPPGAGLLCGRPAIRAYGCPGRGARRRAGPGEDSRYALTRTPPPLPPEQGLPGLADRHGGRGGPRAPADRAEQRARRVGRGVGQGRELRVLRQLAHQHRQRLLRRPAVLGLHLEVLRRRRLCGPRGPGLEEPADRGGRAGAAQPGAGRLAGLLGTCRAHPRGGHRLAQRAGARGQDQACDGEQGPREDHPEDCGEGRRAQGARPGPGGAGARPLHGGPGRHAVRDRGGPARQGRLAAAVRRQPLGRRRRPRPDLPRPASRADRTARGPGEGLAHHGPAEGGTAPQARRQAEARGQAGGRAGAEEDRHRGVGAHQAGRGPAHRRLHPPGARPARYALPRLGQPLGQRLPHRHGLPGADRHRRTLGRRGQGRHGRLGRLVRLPGGDPARGRPLQPVRPPVADLRQGRAAGQRGPADRPLRVHRQRHRAASALRDQDRAGLRRRHRPAALSARPRRVGLTGTSPGTTAYGRGPRTRSAAAAAR